MILISFLLDNRSANSKLAVLIETIKINIEILQINVDNYVS